MVKGEIKVAGILADMCVILVDGTRLFFEGVAVGKTTARSVVFNGATVFFEQDIADITIDEHK